MSRTTRRRPYGFNKGERHYERCKAEYLNSEDRFYKRKASFEKEGIFSDRDWKPMGTVFEPCPHSPKGFNTYCETGTSSRREMKRHTSKIVRGRGKAEVEVQIFDDEWGDYNHPVGEPDPRVWVRLAEYEW